MVRSNAIVWSLPAFRCGPRDHRRTVHAGDDRCMGKVLVRDSKRALKVCRGGLQVRHGSVCTLAGGFGHGAGG